MIDDRSLVSIVIEKEDELLEEISELSKYNSQGSIKVSSKKLQDRLDKLKFSLQFYSKDYASCLENENTNTENTRHTSNDIESHRQTKIGKSFRIDTYKPTAPTMTSIYESLYCKPPHTNDNYYSKHQLKTEPNVSTQKNGKKSLFKIKPKLERMPSTKITPASSPFLATAKKFSITPSPAGVTKKKFFILPQKPRETYLEF